MVEQSFGPVDLKMFLEAVILEARPVIVALGVPFAFAEVGTMP